MTSELWLVLIFGLSGLGYVIVSAGKKIRKNAVPKSEARIIKEHNALGAYRLKVAEEPHNYKHWENWGNALVQEARAADNQSLKLHRYNEAGTCYAQATEIAKTKTSIWINWGVAMYEQYCTQKKGDVFLLEGAHNKFRSALDLDPVNPGLWEQWAKVLNNVANAVGEDQRKGLITFAQECQAKAQMLRAEPATSYVMSEVVLPGSTQVAGTELSSASASAPDAEQTEKKAAVALQKDMAFAPEDM